MITLDALCRQLRGLQPDDLRRWIQNAWVRPDGEPDCYLFRDIDIARVHLILELRDTLRINEDALPVILSLLDQLYEERRRMRRVRIALDHGTAELREELCRLFQV